MKKYGTNVTKFIVQFIAREAIPAGGGLASAVDFFQNTERRKQVLEDAETKAIRAIELIKTAPDNPYGNDDELIAGELLKKIADRKRGQTPGAQYLCERCGHPESEHPTRKCLAFARR